MRQQGLARSKKFLLVEDHSGLPTHADILPDLDMARRTNRNTHSVHLDGKPSPDSAMENAVHRMSLNGSLFEEPVNGLVTAQSSVTVETSCFQRSKTRIQSTPWKDVYKKFAAAMIASGIGQTLAPVGKSPDNILVNPPPLSSLGAAVPLIKNILISPPIKGACEYCPFHT